MQVRLPEFGRPSNKQHICRQIAFISLHALFTSANTDRHAFGGLPRAIEHMHDQLNTDYLGSASGRPFPVRKQRRRL